MPLPCTSAGDNLDINDITRGGMDVEFAEHCDAQRKLSKTTGEWVVTERNKKKGITTAMYVRKLATIFKAAKSRYNDNDNDVVLIPRSPFDNVVVEAAYNEGQKPPACRDNPAPALCPQQTGMAH